MNILSTDELSLISKHMETQDVKAFSSTSKNFKQNVIMDWEREHSKLHSMLTMNGIHVPHHPEWMSKRLKCMSLLYRHLMHVYDYSQLETHICTQCQLERNALLEKYMRLRGSGTGRAETFKNGEYIQRLEFIDIILAPIRPKQARREQIAFAFHELFECGKSHTRRSSHS